MRQAISITGRLGRDVELRYREDGKPFAIFSVATTRKYTTADGQKAEETGWFKVFANGKTAEACAQYLHKGNPVQIEGRLRVDPKTGGPRLWTQQDGTAGASFEVNAVEVIFLPKANNGQRTAAGDEGLACEDDDPLSSPPPIDAEDADGIPF